jgi:hypothetical protein
LVAAAGRARHHLPDYNTGFVRDLLQTEPIGYKSNHLNYRVDAGQRTLAVKAEPHQPPAATFRTVPTALNLRPGGDGLQLVADGSGEAVFEIFTPWIVVPKVNRLDDPSDDTEASIVTLHALLPVTVLVSLDHGLTWIQAATVEPGRRTIDLTPWVKATYGFLLKLQAARKRDETALRQWPWRTGSRSHHQSAPAETWVEPLPLRDRRPLRQADETPVRVAQCRGSNDLAKYVVEMPKDYDLDRQTARIQGDVILKLAAPRGHGHCMAYGGCLLQHLSARPGQPHRQSHRLCPGAASKLYGSPQGEGTSLG